MIVVSEDRVASILTEEDGLTAVEAVFAAMANGDACNFPVIREAIGHADALYGFKSGFDRAGLSLGLKSGGYWPANAKNGLPNHQSTVFLFDPDTGRLAAIVGGNHLTAIRTAAASAVSIKYLARPDAQTLGIVGAGHQSRFQLRAAARMGRFKRVLAWNRHPEMLETLGRTATDLGLAFRSVEREELCAASHVIITITSCHEPLLMREWIRPGTHLACMGTDTAGKMEVDPELLGTASVFTDEVAQSISIGETQHAFKQGHLGQDDITPIGDVINGRRDGRMSDRQITLFDGTGVGLQDLAVASAVAKKEEAGGEVQRIDL